MKKELILINPIVHSGVIHLLYNFIQRTFTGNPISYSLLTLAALTPKEYSVTFINQRQFWRKKDFVDGALVGISCLTATSLEAYQLADRFRKAGSRVVLGGPHVTALPQEALAHADSVVMGEAESVWPDVINDFEKDQLRKMYEGPALKDFFTPVYEYFLRLDPRVLKLAGMYTSRGCKYRCDFCSRISGWLRFVTIEQMVELIKRVALSSRHFFNRKPFILFRCDNIYSSPAYAKELFKKMIPLGVSWAGNASIDIGFDAEALQLARSSGCLRLSIGFETTDPQSYLKTSLPQFKSADDYKIAIRHIRAHGIKIYGSFIIGLDRCGHGDYLKLLWFLMRSGLAHVFLLMATPFPGTELFNRLKKEGRILSSHWQKYDMLTCVMRPKRMSVFGVYGWFWLIRFFSLFFCPESFLILVTVCASYALSYYFTRLHMVGF